MKTFSHLFAAVIVIFLTAELSLADVLPNGGAPTCWDTLLELSPKISTNFDCVAKNALESFKKICSEDGVTTSKSFKNYLTLRDKYLIATAGAQAYLTANPGASKLPNSTAAKIENAENAWLASGRYKIEDIIEQVRRDSSSCN